RLVPARGPQLSILSHERRRQPLVFHRHAGNLARETCGLARWGKGTPRAGKRGFRPAPCCFALEALLGGRPVSCARARRRPARARCGLQLSPAAPGLSLRPLVWVLVETFRTLMRPRRRRNGTLRRRGPA